jgi:hypothetical protein
MSRLNTNLVAVVAAALLGLALGGGSAAALMQPHEVER